MKRKCIKGVGMFVLLLVLTTCETRIEPKKSYNINGLVQKGPFQKGTTITIIELDDNLRQTGRTFFSTVTDDFGTFELPDVQLQSPFIDLIANGYYFDERQGEVSDDRLILQGVADLRDSTRVNVNILTHISHERIKYLVQTEGKEFRDAKAQAEQEMLNIFDLGSSGIPEFEHLDISKTDEPNGKLLAISAILMGSQKASSLNSLLTDIVSDVKEDGILNQEGVRTDILTNAVLLDVGALRKNLSKFYGVNGFTNFQAYCQQFIDQTDFTPLIKLNFPSSVEGEINLLALPDNSTILPDTDYIIAQEFYEDKNLFNDLEEFSLLIDVQIISSTVDIEHEVLDINNWDYSVSTCASQYPCFVRIVCYDCVNASVVPLRMRFTGSGELVIRMHAISPSIANYSRGNGIITKYIRW